jgi:acetyl esterase
MSVNPLLRPELFGPGAIDKETSDFNDTIEKLLSKMPPTYTQRPQNIRDARERGDGLWPTARRNDVEDRYIDGPEGKVLLRVYVPESPQGVYLHIHGGGFMLGRAHQSDEPCFRLANSCRVATVSVDYRLAPEDPYPAGLDDCEAAAVWLAGNMTSEFGVNRLLIGGESAGGNLSAATLLRMRDRHGFTGFAGANLVYGAYDVTGTPSQRNWGEERNLVLTTKTIEWFHENYAPPEKRKDPYVSPLYGDLTDMPKALFTIGTLDPLLDDSLFMYCRWIAAGNEAELAVYPGGIHAFNAFPITLARKANDRIIAFVNQRLELY